MNNLGLGVVECLKKNFKLIKIFIDTKTLDIDGNVADIKDFVYNND